MAKMIPSIGPREFHPSSHEDVIYQALSSLPDDYTIVHSMRMVTAKSDIVKDSEADFVVFNQDFGIVHRGKVRHDQLSRWLLVLCFGSHNEAWGAIQSSG